MKPILIFLFALIFTINTGLFGQDLSNSRVALVSFTGTINNDILSGLDPRDVQKLPYNPEEKELQDRIEKRMEKLFLDDAYAILGKQLEARGIKLEPLELSDRVASLNEKGYPNPLIPKNVIKKKNDNYADYFLNITINCSKPFIGGLLGFKPEARIRLVLHDSKGNKVKTINETAKDSYTIKSTDFDEEWTNLIERFNRMDWYSVLLLEERLLPIVEAAINQGLDKL